MFGGFNVKFAAAILFLLGCATLASADDGIDFFEKKIRPILVEHCYECHGSKAQKVKGGLLLDSKHGVQKGGKSGPVIVAGHPESSLLIIAVKHLDKDLQMPPGKDGRKKLSESQIADLAAWVQMGAPDPREIAAAKLNDAPVFDYIAARTNWAFRLPTVPPVPKVKNKRWPKNSIDHFILEKLEQQKLRPASPVDKRALIRRASYDLTGLPPTAQELEAFVSDRSPGAFSKVVERLLASPHYGERWARHWLDVVRYTDSLDSRVVGTDQDSLDAWRYRDWVVNAFNRDLPYDQFIIHQVAGDILPPPEPGGIDTNPVIATGMYAIGNWGNGDADKDKILTDIADDAVDVTGRAFLGLTLACARCHDHKFDPIPTTDYYAMAGIFFSSHIIPKLSPKGAGESLLRIPLISQADSERRKQRETRMVELEKKIEELQDTQILELALAMKGRVTDYVTAAANASEPALALNKFVLRRWQEFLESGNLGLFSVPVRDLLGNKGLHAWRVASGADTPSVVANSTSLESSFLTIKLSAHRIAIHPSPTAGVAVEWRSPMTGSVQIKGRVVDVDPNCGDGITWELLKVHGATSISLAKGAIASGGMESFPAKETVQCDVKAGEIVQLRVLPKMGYECDTTMVELDVSEMGNARRTWSLNADVTPDFLASNPHPDNLGNADVWRFRDLAETSVSAPPESGLAEWFAPNRATADAGKINGIATKLSKELADPAFTNGLYQSFIPPRGAFWAPLRNERSLYAADAMSDLDKHKEELTRLRNTPTPLMEFTHGLQEGGVPESPHAGFHDVKVHVRGRYDRLGELAPRGFPQLLTVSPPAPIKAGSGRLELAQWLASPDNSLTARVMVNRIWQHHFGEGIVRTPNNYGKLGTPPTHPELLDHLAHQFIASGWSMKAMHRMIMLSATYQQASIPHEETLQADPENKLFGRMNRRRLDAESLRDSFLVAAGKLDRSFGGPAIRDLNNNRRTLYLMTIRSDRSNYRALFDAADPTSIVEQRAVSTVAPQALFVLNHPFVFAQAQAVADNVNKVPGDNRQKILWLYQQLYGRAPQREELGVGLSMLAGSGDPGPDSKNSWLQYCQVLLCANEFVYVD